VRNGRFQKDGYTRGRASVRLPRLEWCAFSGITAISIRSRDGKDDEDYVILRSPDGDSDYAASIGDLEKLLEYARKAVDEAKIIREVYADA